jgi:hypothetical protein
MDYARFLPKLTGYLITGYDIKLYCKMSEFNIGQPNYTCTLSFGGGMKKFCLVATFNNKKPNQIYIDRVDNNDLCTIDNKLKTYEKGTVKLVRIALRTIKQLFPHINKLTLFDDSQILCDESNNLFKLSLSYDYILKYNESWYQKQFSAELPGFISKEYVKNGKFPIVKAEPGTIMDNFMTSLLVLDEPIMDYSQIINSYPQFSEFETEYKAAKTPREFIGILRKKLGEDFCFKVGKWLNQYMVSLRIKLSPEYWYIPAEKILDVPKFSMTLMNEVNTKRILDGGGRRNTKKHSKKLGFRITGGHTFTESFIGSYDEYND